MFISRKKFKEIQQNHNAEISKFKSDISHYREQVSLIQSTKINFEQDEIKAIKDFCKDLLSIGLNTAREYEKSLGLFWQTGTTDRSIMITLKEVVSLYIEALKLTQRDNSQNNND